jgi:hypothetical protein
MEADLWLKIFRATAPAPVFEVAIWDLKTADLLTTDGRDRDHALSPILSA